MTTEELIALFEKHEDEYYLEGVFHKPETYYGPTKRRDLNAFLLLERLVPGRSGVKRTWRQTWTNA